MKILNPVTGNYEEVSIKALDGMSIGMGVDYYGTLNNIPTGWLVCDGSAISRTDYAELFAIIGTQYGSGDGSTTFNLPNKCGKYGVGYDPNDSDFNLIGKTGGSKTVSYTPEGTNTGGSVGGHTLTIDEIPSHTHKTGIQGNKAGEYNSGINSAYVLFDQSSGVNTTATGGGGSHNHPFTQPTFTGTAKNVNVVGPYEVQLFLIKAKDTTAVFASIYNAYSNSTTDGYACSFINDRITNTVSSDSDKSYSCSFMNDYIIEQGSNANGKYIKYGNGAMICYGTNTYSANISNPWGVLYESQLINLGNFPVAFIETPSVTTTISAGRACFLEQIGPTATGLGSSWFARPDNAGTVSVSMCYIAVGRWK